MRINEIPVAQRKTEGAFIKRRMDECEVNQDDLAADLEVAQSTISKWVTGKKPIHPHRLFQLAKLLDFDVFEVRPQLRDYYLERAPSALERELFSVIRMLPKEFQESLLQQTKLQQDFFLSHKGS